MALPFFEDDLTKLYNDALSDKKTIPNEELINIRNTFGVNPEFLLSDSNDYTIDAPSEIDDGIASIDTGLPMYTRDGDGNFFQYGGVDGTDGLIRNYKTSTQKRTNRLTNPNMIEELLNTGMTKIGMIPQRSIGEMMESGEVDVRNTSGIPLGIGSGIARILPDKYYDMSLNDQVFTQAMMGYDGSTVFGKNSIPNKDPFGLNVRSAGILGGGNYAEAVGESFDTLSNQLAGRIAEKYGATFDPNTGTFTGPNAALANKMTIMMRKKYNFRKDQLAVKNRLDTQIKNIRERKAEEAAQRAKDLQTIQQRVNQGESLSSIGKDMYTGPGKAFAPRQDTFTKGKTVTLSDGRQYSSPK
jgi:hypothetical protein